ncbi:MAG: hypothetical protein EPN85_11015 [Bacteroidetes bacterium]|nr:MAG: hypothetical protein EPN85_11015 [Bacteroidota bacterium]
MTPLDPESIYHIYNRANGSEKIFADEGNYHFFLSRYKTYIAPIVDSYCYCLMPNHFHFLVRIKEEEQIRSFFSEQKKMSSSENLANLISNQFSKFFNSYVKAFNKQQNRKGSLLMKNFKRKLIDDEKYLRKVVHYIHQNPVEAKLSPKLNSWKFSSYSDIINERSTFLARSEVISWFENKENFIYCHNNPPTETGIE